MHRRTALALLLAILVSISGCDLPPGGPTPNAPPVSTPAPGAASTPGPEDRIDGYLAVAPKALRSAQIENLAVSIFNGDRPANGTVQVALVKDGKPVATSKAYVRGRAEVKISVP